jgi:hypothetical protein
MYLHILGQDWNCAGVHILLKPIESEHLINKDNECTTYNLFDKEIHLCLEKFKKVVHKALGEIS